MDWGWGEEVKEWEERREGNSGWDIKQINIVNYQKRRRRGTWNPSYSLPPLQSIPEMCKSPRRMAR